MLKIEDNLDQRESLSNPTTIDSHSHQLMCIQQRKPFLVQDKQLTPNNKRQVFIVGVNHLAIEFAPE